MRRFCAFIPKTSSKDFIQRLHPKTSSKDFGAGMGCAGTAGLLRERKSPGPVNVMVLGVVKIQSR
jgi:hypothetical protein